MDAVLERLLGEGCLVYLDDIATYGLTFNKCRECLWTVLRRLGDGSLKVKPSKCQLFHQEVAFLGHIMSGQGIPTNPGRALNKSH